MSTGWWDFLDGERRARQWSEADLARHIGVNQSLISNWKTGSQPSIDRLRSISTTMGISMLTLLVESGHIDADEAEGKAPPLPELPEVDVVAAVEADPNLLPEAKNHLINQYGLLLRVAGPPARVSRTENDGPGLRAVARTRRRGDGNRDSST